MSYDFCLDCGVLLAPTVYDCPVCGYDNSYGHYHDISIDDDFLNNFNETFTPEEEETQY